MKHLLMLLTLNLSASYLIHAQSVQDGWYLFKYPVSNVFGIAYNKPKAKKELSVVGALPIALYDSDFIVQRGPDNFYDLKNHWKNIVLTSLFNNNKNIEVIVNAYKLKRILLKGNKWINFDKGNYYITEALKADSIFITVKVIDTTSSGSKDLETLISTFAAQGTVALKVVDALTLKDTSKNVKNLGIISYKSTKNDSLSIVIKDPDVFFSAKFIELESDAADREFSAPDASMHNEMSKEYKLINRKLDLMEHYYANLNANGIDLTLSFEVDKKKGMANLILASQKTGFQEERTIIQSEKIDDDDVLSFKGVYPYFSDIVSNGYRDSEKYLTLFGYKFDFNPSTMSLNVYGYVDGKYKTYISQIKNDITYWPK